MDRRQLRKLKLKIDSDSQSQIQKISFRLLDSEQMFCLKFVYRIPIYKLINLIDKDN